MGGKGIGDARSVHDSAVNKAREARKLRVRVKKHANAMLLAIEKQEHDLDTNRFKAKHMNLEQEVELLISKTANMDVTKWSKKMLEECKTEVRLLREELAVQQTQRQKKEHDLKDSELSLENLEQRAKMLGIGAYEGTHEVDIKSKHFAEETAKVQAQVDTAQVYGGVLRLMKDRAKLSIGDLPLEQKFLIEEVNMMTNELHAAQMQKLHAIREANNEENYFLELQQTAAELQSIQQSKLHHLREIYGQETRRRERKARQEREAKEFAAAMNSDASESIDLAELYEQYQHATAHIAAKTLRLKQLRRDNKALIDGFDIMCHHGNISNVDTIVSKFLESGKHVQELGAAHVEKTARVNQLKEERSTLREEYQSCMVENDAQEMYKHRNQRLDLERAEQEKKILDRRTEDTQKRFDKMCVLSNGVGNMLQRCYNALQSCFPRELLIASSPKSSTHSIKSKLRIITKSVFAATTMSTMGSSSINPESVILFQAVMDKIEAVLHALQHVISDISTNDSGTRGIPSGAALYSLLSVGKSTTQEGSVRVPSPLNRQRLSSVDLDRHGNFMPSLHDHSDSEHESDRLPEVDRDEDVQPAWVAHVTNTLEENDAEEDYLQSAGGDFVSPERSLIALSPKSSRRKSTIQIGGLFPQRKPADEGEAEEKLITRDKVKHLADVRVKHEMMATHRRSKARSSPHKTRAVQAKLSTHDAGDLSDNRLHVPGRNNLVGLNTSWVVAKRGELISDAAFFLADLQQEMEIKEAIMKNIKKEEVRRGSTVARSRSNTRSSISIQPQPNTETPARATRPKVPSKTSHVTPSPLALKRTRRSQSLSMSAPAQQSTS